MRLASTVVDGRSTFGVVSDDHFVDLKPAFVDVPSLRMVLAEAGTAEIAEAARRHGCLVDLDRVTWLPPIPDVQQVFCVGLNYDTHRRETGRTQAGYPTLFLRSPTTLNPHDGPIERTDVSPMWDYEGELAVVIGSSADHVHPTEAHSHIAGYMPFNDVTVRDYQNHTSQWTPGKNFPTTACCGPWLTTADAVGDIDSAELTTRLNGSVVQQARIEEMIFSIGEIVSYVSSFARLHPGDIVATGTPGGIGARRDPPTFLTPGDVVEVEISGLGTLRNHVVQV